MHHTHYRRLLRALSRHERRGPIILMLIQDDLSVAQSVAHYRSAGATCIIGLGPNEAPCETFHHTAPYDCHRVGAMAAATNALIKAAPGAWVIPVWNGELLYWPHGDTRPLPDLFAFLEDERREVLGGVVLDSYLTGSDHWHIDTMGYTESDTGIRGGLRVRLGPNCPAARSRIDRPLAIKAKPGLRLDMSGQTNDDALNTRHAQWHRSPTGALVSPRVWAWHAAQPSFVRRDCDLVWPGTTTFPDTATALWDLGFIEPGQWV